MKYIIGVDVGGTKIKTILMNKDGKIFREIKINTEANKGKNKVIENIVKSINFVSGDVKKLLIIGVGIGVPGLLNENKDRVLKLPNIKGFNNINLKKILEDRTKLKIKLENDASCMALGEFNFGHGKGLNNLVCITLGTGVGGGIIIDRGLYYGNNYAGEFGHIIIEKNGLKCNCGGKGCLEEYVSVRGIKRAAKKLGLKEKNVIKIQEIAKKGKKKAKNVYENVGRNLGIGLSNIVNVLDPELIVIGGGISNAGDILLKPAVKELNKRTFFNPGKLKKVKLKSNSGAIGAGCLWL